MKYFFKIFSFLFKEEITNIKTSSYNEGYKKCQKDNFKSYKKSKIIEIETTYPIGQLFITICNEWESLSVVEIIDYFNETIPVGKDIITGKEYTIFSNLIPYSEKAIILLKKLNPYERYALSSSCLHYLDRQDKIISNLSFEDEPDCETIFSFVNKYYSLNS